MNSPCANWCRAAVAEQIHLGKLNLDQAAVRFNVNRKTELTTFIWTNVA